MTDHHPSDTQTIESAEVSAGEVDVVADALTIIDGALSNMMQRELVSSGEISDLLLDLRTLLTAN